MRALTTICVTAALATCLASGARADEWNKKTYLTFSGPVAIPGATLPAGTYLFQLADPNVSRHIVQVSSKDGTKHYGLFMTIPSTRMEAPENNVVLFKERPAGMPQAIHLWFYPGDRTGEEFIYSRSEAMRLAKANRMAVLSTASYEPIKATAPDSEKIATLTTAPVARVDENGRDADESSTTATAPAAADPGPAPREARRHLPRTASNLPLFELLSLLALSGACIARYSRRRVAARQQ
jgi:hypothetical protein